MDDFEYGCVMAYYDIPGWENIVSEVNSGDVYNDEEDSYGIEDNPHVTVLFGLKPGVPDGYVERTVEKIDPIPMKVMGTSTFDNEDFDVLKFDVESPYLRKLNKAFCMFPHEKTYPDYKPHLTVSYLEKNRISDYLNLHKKLPRKVFVSDTFVYSKVNGEKKYFNL